MDFISVVARELACSDLLYELAANFPDPEPGSPGRPRDLPHAAHIMYGILVHEKDGEREVDALLNDPLIWEPVRQALAGRCPGYRGLEPGARPISRSEYRRWKDTWAVGDEFFTKLYDTFEAQSVALATAMGCFPTDNMSWTHPASANVVTGDATVWRSRFDAGPGQFQVDRFTGEIIEKRHDPDARYYTTGDDVTVYGTMFGRMTSTSPHENESLALAVYEITDQRTEMVRALEHLERLKGRIPGLQTLTYDKALRGVHIDALYRLGMLTVAKVSDAPGGTAKSRFIEKVDVRQGGAVVGQLDVYAINGAAHAVFVAGGRRHPVRLMRVRTRQPRKHGTTYNDYRLPDDELVPVVLRGGELRLRLDTSELDHRRGLNRAENLRPIPEDPDDPDWKRLYGHRQESESHNSRSKQRLTNKRAPAVGRPRQRLAWLFGAIFQNLRAYLTYRKRVGLPPPSAST